MAKYLSYTKLSLAELKVPRRVDTFSPDDELAGSAIMNTYNWFSLTLPRTYNLYRCIEAVKAAIKCFEV
jgi:hypothetical protein